MGDRNKVKTVPKKVLKIFLGDFRAVGIWARLCQKSEWKLTKRLWKVGS